jgi:sugar phosphate isomerase/epimerase
LKIAQNAKGGTLDAETFFDRYAVSTWLYEDRLLDDALRQIAGAGFRWVETWANGRHLDPRLDVDPDGLRRLLEDLGLRVHSVHTPFSGLNLGHPTLGNRDEWRQVIGASIRQAGRLGARVAVVHPSGHDAALPPALQRLSRQVVRESLADLAEIAQEHGVRVAVENMLVDDYWRFGTSLAELCAELPDRRIGFCLDTGHAAVNGIDVASEVHAAGERLISVHAHSNDGKSDLHYPLMQGVVDWGRVVAALAEIGYPHRLVLETAGAGDPDGMLACLSTLWQEVPG